jgi:AraC-like DNA-binding protein
MRLWQTIRPSILGRHVHTSAYAAIVLSGSYEEAGDAGRHRVRPGDVVFHEAFEAHLNRVPGSGAEVLNVPLPSDYAFGSGLAISVDLDAIVALIQESEWGAVALLLSSIERRDPVRHDWPDELAAALTQDTSLTLSSWSDGQGMSAWEVSRGFARVFEVSPSAFRARARTRRAWKAILTTKIPLARIAAECGFADQSHMTRSVRSMTGKVPSAWRPRCK